MVVVSCFSVLVEGGQQQLTRSNSRMGEGRRETEPDYSLFKRGIEWGEVLLSAYELYCQSPEEQGGGVSMLFNVEEERSFWLRGVVSMVIELKNASKTYRFVLMLG